MPTSASREAIFEALMSLMQGTIGAKTTGRRAVVWTKVPAADQPALFIIQKTQHAIYERGKPTKWKLYADIILYCNSGGAPDTIPAAQINDLLDKVEVALKQGPADDAQTLGGLVSHCAISGEILTDEGVLENQGIAIIPIEIMAA